SRARARSPVPAVSGRREAPPAAGLHSQLSPRQRLPQGSSVGARTACRLLSGLPFDAKRASRACRMAFAHARAWSGVRVRGEGLTSELASCSDGSKLGIGHRKDRTSGRGDRRRRSPTGVSISAARLATVVATGREDRVGLNCRTPKKLFRPPALPVNKNSGARRGGFPCL